MSLNRSAVVESRDADDNPGMAAGHRRRTLIAQGKRIQRLRQDKGWSRTTLARKAKVTVTTIRGCETATKVTQPDKLRAIATALGTSLKRLEIDETEDSRVHQWTSEDYDIGNWYHNAPRAVKNWLWALHERSHTGMTIAFSDPQFVRILEAWGHQMTPEQKAFVLQSFDFITKEKPQPEGGTDALAPAADPKLRGPLR